MEIDEDKNHIPTNYTQVRKGGKATDSDHVPLELFLNVKILPTKPTRKVMYNFKNELGRQLFKNLTSETNQFTKCFDSVQPLQKQCDQWKITLDSYCKQAFPVIRLRQKKPTFSAADKLIKIRNVLKKKHEDGITNKEDEVTLLDLEINIADIIAKEEISKAYSFKKFCAENGSVSVKEMWNLRKKIWPKNQESIPTGKLNHTGKLVTGPQEIKTLLHKEYKERLRPRPTHPNLSHLNEIKNKSFEAKLKEAKKNKSPDWTMSELDVVLKDINKNKSRDPQGIN